ncbi:MAG: 4a-hydroxytetrahydrobiopterin dehydratase, partial [Bradymonadia bacterium]
EFDGFDEAVAFMNQVFSIAKAQDHHPELCNVYNRVTLEMTTHDSGGVSARDLQFIEAVESL